MKRLTLARIEKLEKQARLASVGPATLTLMHKGEVISTCSIDHSHSIVINYTGNVSPGDF